MKIHKIHSDPMRSDRFLVVPKIPKSIQKSTASDQNLFPASVQKELHHVAPVFARLCLNVWVFFCELKCRKLNLSLILSNSYSEESEINKTSTHWCSRPLFQITFSVCSDSVNTVNTLCFDQKSLYWSALVWCRAQPVPWRAAKWDRGVAPPQLRLKETNNLPLRPGICGLRLYMPMSF